MPDQPQGPWSFPPTPEPPRRSLVGTPRRVSVGLAIWLALIAATAAAFAILTFFFPGQVAGMDQTAALQTIGLVALGSSGFVFARHASLGTAARDVAIWVAIVAALIVGYSFRTEAAAFERVRGELIPGYAVSTAPHEITTTASDDGHFYVMGQVNGAPVRFVIDTGASGVVLSPDDARRAGIDPASLKFASPAETANGVGYGAMVAAHAAASTWVRCGSRTWPWR